MSETLLITSVPVKNSLGWKQMLLTNILVAGAGFILVIYFLIGDSSQEGLVHILPPSCTLVPYVGLQHLLPLLVSALTIKEHLFSESQLVVPNSKINFESTFMY